MSSLTSIWFFLVDSRCAAYRGHRGSTVPGSSCAIVADFRNKVKDVEPNRLNDVDASDLIVCFKKKEKETDSFVPLEDDGIIPDTYGSSKNNALFVVVPQVWFRLVDAAGQPYQGAPIDAVPLGDTATVKMFQEAVINKYGGNLLSGVAAAAHNLKVYKNSVDILGDGDRDSVKLPKTSRSDSDQEYLIVKIHVPLTAGLERPLSFFANNDVGWNKYLEFKPEKNSDLQNFAQAVRIANVSWSEPLQLQKDGKLAQKNSGEAFVEEKSSDSDTIRIYPIEFNPEDFDSDDVDVDVVDDVDVDTDNADNAIDDSNKNNGKQDDDRHCAQRTYMVRLPHKVPAPLDGDDEFSCDTLYVTRDHIQIFPVLRLLKRSILTGNPGIGKSWYQWEYLVYLLKPALYQALISLSASPSSAAGSSSSASPSGLAIDAGGAPQVVLMHTAGAGTTEVLFLSESPVVCHQIDDDVSISKLCRFFNSPTALMMYEPGRSMDSVPFEKMNQIRILATLSPDISRYKAFKKHGGFPCYLPCPTTGELLSACAYIRPRIPQQELRDLYTHKETLARINKYGPFTRYVLPLSAGRVEVAKADRDQAVVGLSHEKLLNLVTMQSIEKPDNTNTAPVSHWFLRYDVDRTHAKPYHPASAFLRSSSRSTIEMVRKRHMDVDLMTKITELVKFDASGGKYDREMCQIWLEDVVAELGKLELSWTSLRSESFVYELPQSMSLPKSNVLIKSLEKFKFDDSEEESIVQYSDMVENTVYVKMTKQFPFIDGVWKRGGHLYAFQAMTGSTHPKSVDTLISALGQLDVANPSLEKTIFYVMMPYQFKALEKKPPTASFFWKPVKESHFKIFQLVVGHKLKKLTLCLLCPPENFGIGSVQRTRRKQEEKTTETAGQVQEEEMDKETEGANDDENADTKQHVGKEPLGKKRAAEENNSASEKNNDISLQEAEKKRMPRTTRSNANNQGSHAEPASQITMRPPATRKGKKGKRK